MPDRKNISSRMDYKNSKKKTNTLLNVLIGIVALLIIITVINIVSDNDTETAEVESNQTTTEETTDSIADEEVDEEQDTLPDSEKDITTPETEEEISTEPKDTNTIEDAATEETEEATIVSEQSDDPNVEEVIVDSSWQPIGTTQTGAHASSYTTSTTDWAEKVQALSYASGLDSSNMYVNFIGNGGSPQKSIGTISSKDGNEIYRIYLEWIDGEGWKPTKKEKLKKKDAS